MEEVCGSSTGRDAAVERGGEIVDLPEGSRVIPHDVSMRMAEKAGRGGGGGHVSIGFDKTVGDLTASFEDVAGRVVQKERAGIISDSVQATGRTMAKTKKFGQ
jgi:phage-related protein